MIDCLSNRTSWLPRIRSCPGFLCLAQILDIPRALFAAGVSVIDSTPCTGVLKQVPASYLALWEVAPMGCARSTNPCACYAQIRLILHETGYGALCGKIAAKNGRELKKASLAP